MGELQSDICKNLREFYQISLKNLPYLTDLRLQLMACMNVILMQTKQFAMCINPFEMNGNLPLLVGGFNER